MVARFIDRLSRAFALPSAVDTSWVAFGIPSDEWTPAEYGEYLATSNAVYTCVTKRAQAVSSVPLQFFRGDTPVERGPLPDLFGRVNPFWTFNRLMHMTEQSLCLWGQSFWFLERGTAGRSVPQEIWWARPDRVKVYPDPMGYVSHFGYDPETGGQEIAFLPTETLWLRYPNPLNEWAGLAPLAAARLAADTMSAAMKSNRNLFAQGMQLGGIISPKAGQPMLTDEQGKKLEEQFNRKFKGVDNAHRWAVLKLDMQFQTMQMSPVDAEFVELHRMTLEDICRAFGVPLDLIGGQRTYANAAEARHAFWADTITPELAFIASEITEQILPMFGTQADRAAFALDGVEALQENEDAKQLRIRDNYRAGILTLNQTLEQLGFDPLGDDGDVLAVPSGVTFLRPSDLTAKADMAMQPPPEPVLQDKAGNAPDASQNASQQEKPRAVMSNTTATLTNSWISPPIVVDFTAKSRTTRAVEYGSDDHRRLWERAVSRTDRHEATFGRVTANLMRDQRKSVLSRLNGRTARAADPEELAAAPFILAEWVKKFRAALRPVYLQIVQETGEAALREIGIGVAFDVQDPNVLRFIETRSQRFAQQVNETTWDALRTSLRDGIDAGESIPDLANRVNAVMGDRIRSSDETIARTETIGASNGGTLESWRQSGVVKGKTWLAALDERTRDTHIEAHNQTVPIDSDFLVGGGSGPAPGQIGLAEEDINCFVGETVVYAEAIQAATRRWYSGSVIELTTDSGRVITVTPNHPLLSVTGWKSAGEFVQGDDLLGYALIEHPGLADPYPHNGPTEIAEIFRLAEMSFDAKRVAGRSPQFHGDGVPDGDVEIVWTNGELRGYGQPTILKPNGDGFLTATDIDQAVLLRDGTARQFVDVSALATNSIVSGSAQSRPFFRSRLSHAGEHRFAAVSRRNAALLKATTDRASINAELLGKRLYASPGLITVNKVVNVDVVAFSGHVYNLHTNTSHYTANGIISRNCRCAMTAVLDVDWEG